MPRYALRIEYDGSPYCGWQTQPDQPSVQGVVEKALAVLDPSVTRITAAGRTDTGVHAIGQVAHCDLQKQWDPFKLSEALNAHIRPAPIAITAVAEMDDDWHARFSAVERQYQYRIVHRRASLTFSRGMIWHVRYELDVDAMRRAAQHLIGRHDFTTFRSTKCQSVSPVKTLDEISISTHPFIGGGTEILVNVRARSFLHNQVRSIVGTLERVGTGRWAVERVGEVLAAKDRVECGPVAPPHGLYLKHVEYPQRVFGP